MIFSPPGNIQWVTPKMRAEMPIKALSKWKRVREFQLSFGGFRVAVSVQTSRRAGQVDRVP
jgi:hypothetical protein